MAAVASTLNDRVVKHTNLTGGLPAWAGGELWFAESTTCSVWISGASGRYGPGTPEELADLVDVFRAFGYEATSLGWDEQENRPARMYRAEGDDDDR
ncbi:MAG: hypothetical protein AABZ30_06450 [Myxococcota bacterium]